MASNQGGYWTPDIQSYVYNRLRTEAGVSDAGARGLISRWMNVEAPDGPTSVNPTSGAQGIGQWLGSRLPGIAGNTGLDDQLSYAIGELNGPESKAGNALRAATTESQGATGASMYERAAGYNGATGRDNFTNMTQSEMASVAVPQYDSAGNPIAPQPASAPAPAAASAAPAPAAGAPPAQINSVLDEALGPTAQSSPASSAAPNVNSVLDEALGPAGAPPTTSAAPNVETTVGDRATDLRAGTAPATAASSPVLDNASGAFQQATMGDMPVIGPLVNGAIDFVGSHIASAITGKSPEEMQQAAQAREQQIAIDNPAATMAGDIVGSVLPFSAVGSASGAAKLLGTAADYGAGPVGNALLRTAAGAGSGATIAGADTLARGGTTQQATNNALLGGAVGGVAPAVLGLAGKAIGGVKNAFLGPSAPKMLSNALVADQNDPAAINALLQQRGPGATVSDLGANTRGLAGGLASLPGKPQSIVVNNLAARASQTGDRLAQDVAGTIGQGQPIGALTDSIINAQKSAADPLYAAVRGQPIQMTPELQEFLSTPLGKSALAQGQQLAANDGVKLGVQEQPTAADVANQVLAGKLTPQQGEQQMASIASGSQPAIPNLNVGILDYAKRALDDQASAAVRAGTNNAARQASGKASQLTGIIDAQVPAYAQARAAFAGPAKVLDAVDMGQQIFSGKTSPEDLQSTLSGMSPSEKDGLLAGAQSAVQKAIGNARTDAAGVKSLFDSANGKEKLALLVGQDQADQISAALDRERAFSATNGKVANNSVTSANLAQQRVLSPELAGVPKQMAPQSSIGLLISGLEKARSAVTGAYRNTQNVWLANMLTGGALSPEDAAAVAGAGKSRNALLAAAPGVPGIARETGAPVPGRGSFDQPDRVFRDGHWIPRIYVRGANPLIQ